MPEALRILSLFLTFALTICRPQDFDASKTDQNAVSSVPFNDKLGHAFLDEVQELKNSISPECTADTSQENPLDPTISDSILNEQIVRRQSGKMCPPTGITITRPAPIETPPEKQQTLQSIPLSSLMSADGKIFCPHPDLPIPVSCGGAEVGRIENDLIEGLLGCIVGESTVDPIKSKQPINKCIQDGNLNCHPCLLGNLKKSPGTVATSSMAL